MKSLKVIHLGLIDYNSAWTLQKNLSILKMNKQISDVLLLLEHNHVYTIGKSGDEAHLLADEEELRAAEVKVYNVDRGGDITYHGPGQLVGYPILDLNDYYLDIHRYLRDLEEVIIQTLNDFRIKGKREENYTGVWVSSEKIASIGVKVSRWITMHGFALNVNTDLSFFNRIIPCGIFHKGVTSMQKILGNNVAMSDVINSVSKNFSDVFNVETKHIDKDEFLSFINNLSNEKIEYLQ